MKGLNMKINIDVIDAYQDGKDVDAIARDNGLSHNEVLEALLDYKVQQFAKSHYSDEFKMFVAERVSYGYTKTQVSKELDLAQNTVAKFCKIHRFEENSIPIEEKLYTFLDVEYVEGQCPECKSKHFNHVDWSSYYCFDCGNEYKIVANTVQKLNFEFL